MKNLLKNIISLILEWEARLILKKYKPRVVAVTGNVGKTSTKDAIYTVMADSFHVRKSEKSFNSDIGVPLTILGCANAWNNPLKWVQNILVGLELILLKKKYPDWLVLEVGADRPGDIAKISAWLKPDVVVVTKFAEVPVHIEYFKSRAALIAEKGKLVEALKHDGTLVLNSDDVDVYAFRQKVPNKMISYGQLGDAVVRATNYSIYNQEGLAIPAGITFKVEYQGNCVPIKLPNTLGLPNIYAALAAISVGLSLGLNLVQCSASLMNFIPPRGRMNLLKGILETYIIDDTYNASPVAVKAALDTLKELQVSGRKIAVLGDMLELGKHSHEAHESIGKEAATSCDLLITVGLRSRDTATSALENGLSEKKVLQFDDSIEAGKYLKNILKTGDVVLVKGSQSIRMERIVKEIMAEIDRAEELLVRQDDEWKKR